MTDSLIKAIETALCLPVSVNRATESSFSHEKPNFVGLGHVHSEIVGDASVLTCGCIVSESLATSQMSPLAFLCPVCGEVDTKLLGPVAPLRALYLELQKYKVENDTSRTELQTRRKSSSSGKTALKKVYADNYSRLSPRSRRKDKVSLLTLFQTTALRLKDEEYDGIAEPDTNLSSQFNFYENRSFDEPALEESARSYSAISAASAVSEDLTAGSSPQTKLTSTFSSYLTRSESQRSDSSSTVPRISMHSAPTPIAIPKNNSDYSVNNTPNSLHFMATPPINESKQELRSPEEDFSKEIRFANNFPVYRKRIQYSTGSSKVKSLLKRSEYIGTAISPDATKFALIEQKKWVVYTINPDSSQPPELLCCGRNNSFYGASFEDLYKLNPSFYSPERYKLAMGDEATQELVEKGNWLFEYCALGNNYFVIAGKKIIKVFDLRRQGKVVYTYNIGLPIRCLDIACNDQFIACGLTGRDKVTDSEGSLIMLFELYYEQEGQNKTQLTGSEPKFAAKNDLAYSFANANSSLITLHYKDPINIVKFSPDPTLMGVSTALESRFMVINLSNPSDPRMVMKASRKLDTSYESEGITDLCFFGDNNRYMTVTSVAFNAPSLVLDTRISNLRELDSVAHPKMLMKIEEIGSSVHKCCISPRNDAFAFINKKGSVFIVNINKNFERKRVVLAGDVMNATKKSEAASLRFSKDGYKLYVIDRKGALYIEDFIAGTPQNHDVSKCKSIM